MAEEKGIILRKTRYSESDLIIQVLTRNGEILNLIARSALKSKKRFGGGILEPTHYIHFEYDYKPDKLSVLNEARLLDEFSNLKHNYESLMLGLFIVELASKTAQEGDSLSEKFFNLVGNALKNVPDKNHQQYRLMFLIKFLHAHGVLQLEDWMRDYLTASITDFKNQSEHLRSENLKHIDRINSVVSQWTGKNNSN